MKQMHIQVGGHYLANVSGKRVTVRVEDVFPGPGDKPRWQVTNLTTGRKLVFRSARRFLAPAPAVQARTAAERLTEVLAEQAAPVPADEVEELVHPERTADRLLRVPTTAFGRKLEAALERVRAAEKAPHLIVAALAGTGKTTTLIEGLKHLKGLPTKITPSGQQRAVWEQLALTPASASVCFVAFNKAIATELQARVPPGCQAMTMHSLGYRAVTEIGRAHV